MRILKTTFTLLLMIIIFYFSSQPATQSSELSGGICYRLVSMADKICNFSLAEEEKLSICEKIETPIRKLAHMTEYAILSISIYFTLDAWNVKKKRLFLLAILCTCFYAMTDEFHQLFIVGRSGEIRDVIIDTCGGTIGILLITILKKIKNKLNK